jgi:multiple antibiotic resistance protein
VNGSVAEFARYALTTLTSILFLVDPVAVVPTFLAITGGTSTEQRRATARRACVAAGAVLLGASLAGAWIFRLLGITMPAFRIAGGFILWVVASDMLRGRRTTQEGGPEIAEGQAKDDVAITPLAVPMLAGPGAISTTMVLAGQADTLTRSAVVYAAIVATMLMTWVLLRVAERLFARLGRTGIRVVTRLMGLLLAAVAVQFIVSGVGDALAARGFLPRGP